MDAYRKNRSGVRLARLRPVFFWQSLTVTAGVTEMVDQVTMIIPIPHPKYAAGGSHYRAERYCKEFAPSVAAVQMQVMLEDGI
jgi:hypothetical protein